MGRYDLTDFDWRVIEPLLPDKPKGVPHVRYCRAMKRGSRVNGRSAGVMPNGTDASSAGRIVARRWSKFGRSNVRLMLKDRSLENQNAINRLAFVPRAARPKETFTANRP
jgi:transposase